MRTIDSAFCIRILHNSLAVHLDHARRVQLAKQPCKRAVGACTHSQSDVQHTYEAIKTPGDEEDVSVVTLKVELREALKTAAMCDRRQRRLKEKARCLKEAAVKALQESNDGNARKLLEVKAKVLESAAASERRAQINRKLADKLEDVLQAL